MSTNQTEPGPAAAGSTTGTIGYLLFGPIVWAAHLTVLYFSQSMLCAHEVAGNTIFGIGIVPAIIALATALALALLLAAVVAPDALRRLVHASAGTPSERAFRRRVMVALAVLAACGVAWAGVTVTVLPTCAQLR